MHDRRRFARFDRDSRSSRISGLPAVSTGGPRESTRMFMRSDGATKRSPARSNYDSCPEACVRAGRAPGRLSTRTSMISEQSTSLSLPKNHATSRKSMRGFSVSALFAAARIRNVPCSLGNIVFRMRFLLASVVLVLTPRPGLCAQQLDPPSPVPTTTPTTPFPNRANEVLPSWLRVRGEFRERMEGFAGGGFTNELDDLYWLSRFRFNATVTPTRLVSFSVQAQDARVADKSIGTTGPPFKGTFDLRAVFADIGDARTRVTARVGRQELAYGEQRLLGHLNWTNTARTFDAARVTIRGSRFDVDLFGGSVVRSPRRPVRQKRKRESTRRRLWVQCHDRPAKHDRAVCFLEDGTSTFERSSTPPTT